MIGAGITLRHRTAISRGALSRPLRLAVESDLIHPQSTVLDYGCGRGDDVQALRAHGIECLGWDPVYQPEGERREAHIVNLGYVVNVIEDTQERAQTLCAAWQYAQQVLIVAARLNEEPRAATHQPYNDGYLTQRGTFQKFFAQHELREWIDTTLRVQSVAAAPGIFFVFRDENLRQSYLASRYRRHVVLPRTYHRTNLFERHKELLQSLIRFVIDYRTADSPPILHRKEAFVPADYPLREKFARLTRQKERWGLYEHPTAIGTRQAWERLLAAKGVRLTGHRVTRVASSSGECCTAPLKR